MRKNGWTSLTVSSVIGGFSLFVCSCSGWPSYWWMSHCSWGAAFWFSLGCVSRLPANNDPINKAISSTPTIIPNHALVRSGSCGERAISSHAPLYPPPRKRCARAAPPYQYAAQGPPSMGLLVETPPTIPKWPIPSPSGMNRKELSAWSAFFVLLLDAWSLTKRPLALPFSFHVEPLFGYIPEQWNG